jgi:hypothetical protein
VKPKPARSFSFVLAVPIGILLLWVAGLAALLTPGGDCFDSESECRAIGDVQVVQQQVLVATVVGLSVLGFLAIAVGRRVLPAALLAASVTTLLLGLASGAPALWWVPKSLGLILLPVAILALAAAGQVIDQVHWRPRWLRTWRGE